LSQIGEQSIYKSSEFKLGSQGSREKAETGKKDLTQIDENAKLSKEVPKAEAIPQTSIPATKKLNLNQAANNFLSRF
jgi:hypothetical protein